MNHRLVKLLLCVLVALLFIKANATIPVKILPGYEVFENSLVMHGDANGNYFVGTLINNINAKVVMWNSTLDVVSEFDTPDPYFPNSLLQRVKPQFFANYKGYITAHQDSISGKYYLLKSTMEAQRSHIMLDTVRDEPIIAFYTSDYVLNPNTAVVTTKGVLGIVPVKKNVWFKELPELTNGKAQLMRLPMRFALFTSNGYYLFDIFGRFYFNIKVNMLVNAQEFFTISDDNSKNYIATIQEYEESSYGMTLYFMSDVAKVAYTNKLLDSNQQPIDMPRCSNILVSNSTFFFVCNSKSGVVAYAFKLMETEIILYKEIKVHPICQLLPINY